MSDVTVLGDAGNITARLASLAPRTSVRQRPRPEPHSDDSRKLGVRGDQRYFSTADHDRVEVDLGVALLAAKSDHFCPGA